MDMQHGGKIEKCDKMFVPYAEWKAKHDLSIDGIKIYKCILSGYASLY
jgi:hypothetical protein